MTLRQAQGKLVTTYFIGSYYELTAGVATKYYYSGGQRVAMRKNGTLYYMFSDHLGSTSLTTDLVRLLIKTALPPLHHRRIIQDRLYMAMTKQGFNTQQRRSRKEI